MPSYFRNLFGGSSSKSSHSRSNSQPAPMYATPTASGSTAGISTPTMQRTYSHTPARSNTPSPLRYTTGGDTRTVYGYGRAPSASQPRPEPRPHQARRASFKTPETRKWHCISSPAFIRFSVGLLTTSGDSLQPAQRFTRPPCLTRRRRALDRTQALPCTRASLVGRALVRMPGTTAMEPARPSARIKHGTLRVPRALRRHVCPFHTPFTLCPWI